MQQLFTGSRKKSRLHRVKKASHKESQEQSNNWFLTKKIFIQKLIKPPTDSLTLPLI